MGARTFCSEHLLPSKFFKRKIVAIIEAKVKRIASIASIIRQAYRGQRKGESHFQFSWLISANIFPVSNMGVMWPILHKDL